MVQVSVEEIQQKSAESCMPTQQHDAPRLPSLNETYVRRLATLPPVHRDRFDRMLVCQALVHILTLLFGEAEKLSKHLV